MHANENDVSEIIRQLTGKYRIATTIVATVFGVSLVVYAVASFF